jgi:adenylate cyclase
VPLRDTRDRRGGPQAEGANAAGRHPTAGVDPLFRHPQLPAISERLEPEKIVEFLNDYFGSMVQEIFAEQGTLDKFIGDGIMAVFGAPISRPDDPVRAVRAARGMRRGLRAFNARQRARGGVEIDIGIGISHGESLSGNIGSEQRMEYTVIGDSVNLASRLEGLTKNHPYKILINDQI